MDIDGSSLLQTLVHVFQSTCQIYDSIFVYGSRRSLSRKRPRSPIASSIPGWPVASNASECSRTRKGVHSVLLWGPLFARHKATKPQSTVVIVVQQK